MGGRKGEKREPRENDRDAERRNCLMQKETQKCTACHLHTRTQAETRRLASIVWARRFFIDATNLARVSPCATCVRTRQRRVGAATGACASTTWRARVRRAPSAATRTLASRSVRCLCCVVLCCGVYVCARAVRRARASARVSLWHVCACGV